MKTAKLAGAVGALVVAALVGGALIRTTAAESPTATPSSSPGAKGAQYCQTFYAAFAKNLGVDVSALEPAAKSAADATIDAAVANGDLTQAKADAMKKRIADAKGNGCALLAGRFHRLHSGILKNGFRLDLGTAAATALKMEPAALRDALRKGTSLKDVAKAQGVDYTTVTSAVHNAAKADLDKAVAAGRLTAEREKKILDRLDAALQAGTWPHRRG